MDNPAGGERPPTLGWDPPRPAPQPGHWSVMPPPGQKAATASLVCGIVGLAVVFVLCVVPFAALILGIIAVRQAAKSRRQAAAAGAAPPSNAGVGRGLGIAAIVLGSLATVALAGLIVAAATGALDTWWNYGEEPVVLACEANETSTLVTVELVAGDDETITYDYTVEVRDRSNVIAEVSRSVAVHGVEQETVLVPIPNGRTCTISYWSAW